MAKLYLKGGKGTRGKAEGITVVTQESFSFFSDVDPMTGKIVLKYHELYGENISGKILIFFTAKGGVGSAWRLPEMKENGCAPKAIVMHSSNPIMMHASIMADIPLIEGLEKDPTKIFKSGDRVVADADRGELYSVD